MILEIDKFIENDNIFIVNNIDSFKIAAQDFFDIFKKELRYFKTIQLNNTDLLLSIEYIKALVIFYKLCKKMIENKYSLHQLIKDKNNLLIKFELDNIEDIKNNNKILLEISNTSGIEIKKRLLINNNISFESTNDFDIIFNQDTILDPRELIRLLYKDNLKNHNYFFLTSLDQIIEDALKIKCSYYLEISYLNKVFIEDIKVLKNKKLYFISARQLFNFINRLIFSIIFLSISFQFIPIVSNFNIFIIFMMITIMVLMIQVNLEKSSNKLEAYLTMPKKLLFLTLVGYTAFFTILTLRYDYIFKLYESVLIMFALIIFYVHRIKKIKNSEVSLGHIVISMFLLVTLMSLFYRSYLLFAAFFILINLLLFVHKRGKV
jgi:hypothetical protein